VGTIGKEEEEEEEDEEEEEEEAPGRPPLHIPLKSIPGSKD
jgi:hypothetical protein